MSSEAIDWTCYNRHHHDNNTARAGELKMCSADKDLPDWATTGAPWIPKRPSDTVVRRNIFSQN